MADPTAHWQRSELMSMEKREGPPGQRGHRRSPYLCSWRRRCLRAAASRRPPHRPPLGTGGHLCRVQPRGRCYQELLTWRLGVGWVLATRGCPQVPPMGDLGPFALGFRFLGWGRSRILGLVQISGAQVHSLEGTRSCPSPGTGSVAVLTQEACRGIERVSQGLVPAGDTVAVMSVCRFLPGLSVCSPQRKEPRQTFRMAAARVPRTGAVVDDMRLFLWM